jgi:hypothetical protein
MIAGELAKRAVAQIGARLHAVFGNKIDVSDCKSTIPADRDVLYNSRALAGLYLKNELPLSGAAAAKSITDGGKDGGIDAVAWNESSKTLFIVQSKWKQNPQKGLELGDFLKMKSGIARLLELDATYFNPKITSAFQVVKEALNDIDTRLKVVLVHTSAQPLSTEIIEEVKALSHELNQYDKAFFTFYECGLSNISNIARAEARSANINLEVLLKNFGYSTGPYRAFYGELAATDAADWYSKYKDALFAENLRFVLPSSDVNQAILETIQKRPEAFWYYNNGITAVCREISKRPIGGADSSSGVFDVEGVSIVNGAQTVGSIYAAAQDGVNLEKVKLQVRFIPLKEAPEDFGSNVTRTNNTQNSLAPMDFVALDPNQERLAGELRNLGVQYAYRRGETIKDNEKGIDLREATLALACANADLKYAVYAKRYISGLWEDIRKEPYTIIFNEKVSGRYLWALVRLARSIDARITELAEHKEGRERLVLVHGNRFLMHMAFCQIDLSSLDKKGAKLPPKTKQALEIASDLGPKLVNVLNEKFQESYPGNIFKNQEKQDELKLSLSEKLF